MSETGSPFEDSLLSFAESDPRILSVYLLGSANSGHLRPDSDIDLAILAKPGQELGPEERAALMRDPALAGILESNLLSVYARFNEDRREILDAYRA